jgi:hypothetical protein
MTPDTNKSIDEVAWEAEVVVRVRQLDDGSVKPIPWSEARRIIAGRGCRSGG